MKPQDLSSEDRAAWRAFVRETAKGPKLTPDEYRQTFELAGIVAKEECDRSEGWAERRDAAEAEARAIRDAAILREEPGC